MSIFCHELLNKEKKSIVNLQATRKIENVTDPADYGLGNPAVTVTAVWQNGGSTAYSMGDETPFQDGYYLEVSGQSGTIYTIASSLKTSFDKTQTELAAMEEIPAIENVTGFSVSTGLKAVKKNESNTIDPDQLWYEEETGAALDGGGMEDLISSASGIKWKELAAVNATDEELDGWELSDEKARVLTLTGPDGAAVSVLFGTTNEDSDFYARLPGSAMVYTVEGSDVSSLLTSGSDKLQISRILPLSYESLAWAELEADSFGYRLEPTEGKQTDEAENGADDDKEPESDPKQKLWEQVTDLVFSGAPETELSLETRAVLRIHAAGKNGKETEILISEYNADDYLVTTDGSNPRTVAADSVDALIRAARTMQ